MWVLAGLNAGCASEFVDPIWNEDALHSPAAHHAAERPRWVVVSTTTGDGRRGLLSEREMRTTVAGCTVSLTVSLYDGVTNSEQRYERIADVCGLPVYQRGESDGYRYALSQCLRPRNDPAGGSLLQDRRITYLVMCKNRTVIRAEITSSGAGRRVNMTTVASEIVNAVGDW